MAVFFFKYFDCNTGNWYKIDTHDFVGIEKFSVWGLSQVGKNTVIYMETIHSNRFSNRSEIRLIYKQRSNITRCTIAAIYSN